MTQRSSRRAVAVVAAGVVALGCLACAGVATPPLRASIAAGPASGTATTALRFSDGTLEPGLTARPTATAALETRVGVYPLALAERTNRRRWDIGAGYAYTQFFGPRHGQVLPVAGYHAVFFSTAVYPWISPRFDSGFGRWGLRLDLNVPLADDTLAGRVGIGASLATELEWAGWSHVAWRERDSSGRRGMVFHGEAAIGLRLAVSAYEVGGTSAWTATAGFSVEIPALAVAGVVHNVGD